MKDIDGVLAVEENSEIIVKVKDDTVVPKVFSYVAKQKNITKFCVEEATLNEIFIEKVGEAYEK